MCFGRNSCSFDMTSTGASHNTCTDVALPQNLIHGLGGVYLTRGLTKNRLSCCSVFIRGGGLLNLGAMTRF